MSVRGLSCINDDGEDDDEVDVTNAGDVVHVNVRGASQDVPVRLVRSSVSMDATYVTMSSQKLVAITNRSDVIARFRWTRFATPEAEQQHRAGYELINALSTSNFAILPGAPFFIRACQ